MYPGLEADIKTYENENTVSILLPAKGHFVVLFLCHLNVLIEEGSRAIREVGLSLRGLILRLLRKVRGATYNRGE
jgi:hypothetical protein